MKVESKDPEKDRSQPKKGHRPEKHRHGCHCRISFGPRPRASPYSNQDSQNCSRHCRYSDEKQSPRKICQNDVPNWCGIELERDAEIRGPLEYAA